MIGSFGGVAFSVSDHNVQNFEDLKRDTSARFANHEVIGTKPKSEFLGPGLNTLSFAMELSVFLGASPMSMIGRLHGLCRSGSTSYFILGGKNLGCYKLLSVSEGYGIISNNGAVLTAKVDVSLEEYQ